MKRFILMLLMVSVVSLTVYSQSIKVVSPKGGSVWVQGKPMNIEWIKKGQMDQRVKITLFKAGSSMIIHRIVKPTKNDKHFRWVIPANISNGKYYILVKTMNNKVSGRSGEFSLGKKEEPKKEEPKKEEPKKENKFDPNLPSFDPNAGNTLYPKYKIKEVTLASSVIDYFKPERGTINYGESVKLLFHYKGTTKAEIFNRTTNIKHSINNPKYPDFKSYIIVKPEKSSNFELIVAGAVNKQSKKCQVEVRGQKPPENDNLPTVLTRFKAVPVIVDYGKETTLRFKITHATKITLKDPTGKIIFSWRGKVSDVVDKSIPAKVYKGKNEYKLEAENNHGAYLGFAWARYKPAVIRFSARRNGGKILFNFEFSLANTAYIKMVNPNTRKWERIHEITPYWQLNTPKVHIGKHTAKYIPTEYKLFLIGTKEVVTSKPVIIH